MWFTVIHAWPTLSASFAVAGNGTSFAGLKSLGTSAAGLPGARGATAPKVAGEMAGLSDSSVLIIRSNGYLSGDGTPSAGTACDAGDLWSRTGTLLAGGLLGCCCAKLAPTPANSNMAMAFFISAPIELSTNLRS